MSYTDPTKEAKKHLRGEAGRPEPGIGTGWAILALAEAVDGLAIHLRDLGTGTATTGGMGALELLRKEVRDGLAAVSGAIDLKGS